MDVDMEIRRLRLRPTDRVLVSCAEHLSHDQANRLREAFAKSSGLDNRVLVLDGGLTVAVIAEEPETSLSILADMIS